MATKTKTTAGAMRAAVNILRDGVDLVYRFTFRVGGDRHHVPAPVGFVAFGRPGWGMHAETPLAVLVRGVRGDLMPLRATHDWLTDRGVVVTIPDWFARGVGLAG